MMELLKEDRAFGGDRLFVDLVPSTSFFENARAALSPSHWRALSRFVRERVGHCEGCGRECSAGERDAHERWQYDEVAGVQRLVRMVALCRACHGSTHYGLARVRGYEGVARAHLMRVNGWTPAELNAHIADAEALWLRRSAIAWRQDFSILGSVARDDTRPAFAQDLAPAVSVAPF